MFKANYKATMKAMLRSPVILLAFGATVILTLALYKGGIVGQITTVAGLRNQILNDVQSTCYNLFPPFIGLMISAHILSEKQNGFGDLLVSSRKSILSIYLSKLCAVGTVTLVARAIFLAASIAWTWGVKYPEALADVSLSFGKILACYAANEVVFMPFLLLCYTAMPVFITVATNIPATGAVWNVAFSLANDVSTSFHQSSFTLPPYKFINYVATFIYIDDPQYMAALQGGMYPFAGMERVAPLPEVLTVYIGWIVFSLALLTAAYFILKRRYRR